MGSKAFMIVIIILTSFGGLFIDLVVDQDDTVALGRSLVNLIEWMRNGKRNLISSRCGVYILTDGDRFVNVVKAIRSRSFGSLFIDLVIDQDEAIALGRPSINLIEWVRNGERNLISSRCGIYTLTDGDHFVNVVVAIRSESSVGLFVDLVVDQDEVVVLGRPSTNLIERLQNGKRNSISSRDGIYTLTDGDRFINVVVAIRSRSFGGLFVDLVIDWDEAVALGRPSTNFIERLQNSKRNLIFLLMRCVYIDRR